MQSIDSKCAIWPQKTLTGSSDDWEATRDDYTRTLHVLHHFESQIHTALGNGAKIMLLCGADLMLSLGKPGVWKKEHVNTILGRFGLVVVERENNQVGDHIFSSDILYKHRDNIYNVTKYVKSDLSSSKVRFLRRRGYSIRYYVHDAVWMYIESVGLYPPLELTENHEWGVSCWICWCFAGAMVESVHGGTLSHTSHA